MAASETTLDAEVEEREATPLSEASLLPMALASAALLSACGGGGGAAPSDPTRHPSTAGARTATPSPPSPHPASWPRRRWAPPAPTSAGSKPSATPAWIDEQIALPQSMSRWDWMVSKGYDALANKNSETGADPAIWRKLLSSPDTLRQRVTFALSEIRGRPRLPVSAAAGTRFRRPPGWICWKRTPSAITAPCCSKCSTSAPMGEYLTFRGNVKFNRHHRRHAGRELRPRNHAAVHHRPGAAEPGRHRQAGQRRAPGNLHARRHRRPGARVHGLELRPDRAPPPTSPSSSAAP